jgi:hypothetical protein
MTRARFTRCLMISTFPLAVITPACGGSGSEPTPVSVAGGWVGTVQDNIVGAENRWTPILLHRTSVIQVYGDDREVSSSATCISHRTNLNRFLVDAPTRTIACGRPGSAPGAYL